MTAAEGLGTAANRLAWALEAIREASARFAGTIERRGVDGLDANVPSTPEWSLRDLAHHVGEVQRFWAENVRVANPDGAWPGKVAPPTDDVLAGWLRQATASLCDALEAAGPAAPCWTWWGEPATAGAVARHQVQEIAVHAWDAEAVGGVARPAPPGRGGRRGGRVPRGRARVLGRRRAGRRHAAGHRHGRELAGRRRAGRAGGRPRSAGRRPTWC